MGLLFSHTLSLPSRMRNTHFTLITHNSQCIRTFGALRFIRMYSTDLFVLNSFVRRRAADVSN